MYNNGEFTASVLTRSNSCQRR